MNRREFVYRSGLTAAGLALTDPARLLAQRDATPRWRVVEITTQVHVLQPRGVTRVWIPTPLAVAPYQKTMGDTYHPGDGTAVMIETNAYEPDILGCSWDEGVEPVLTLASRVAITDHHADLETPNVPPQDLSALSRFLQPTRLISTDGAARVEADAITKGAGTDIERARAIFDRVVATTWRDPKTRGSADVNALFVGLCRATGIPARAVYGLRTLGLPSGDATRAQHCRAEAYLTGYGWVPMDPAEGRTFGSWETNWIAYNFAQDVSLRGSSRPPLGYFMYPQGETAEGPIDSLDPEHFKYSITVEEVTSA